MTPHLDKNSLECHFNWNIIENTKPNWLFEDRIQKIETDLERDTRRNLPQLYSTKGFLQTLYYERRRDQVCDDQLDKLKIDAEKSFCMALEKTEEANKGYRAVVLANLVYFHTNHEEDQKVREYLKEYESLAKLMEPIADHPEVLAMKGYGLSHLLKRDEAASAYQQALNNQVNEPKPAEWYFGFALAKEGEKISLDDSDLMKIESSLDEKVLDLQPKYDYAKLKLARIRWKLCGYQVKWCIKQLVNEVIEANPKNVALLEEAASVLMLILDKRDENKNECDEIEKIYKNCLELDGNSQKALREIGKFYYYSWTMNKEETFIQKAIDNYEKLTKISTKIFDKEQFARFHSDLWHHSKQRNLEKNRKHKTISEDLYKKILRQVDKENAINQVSVWYWYWLYQQRLLKQDEQEEKKYLIKIMVKIKEEIKGETRFIKVCSDDAFRRLKDLTPLPEDPTPSVENTDAFVLRSYVDHMKGNCREAVEHIKNAIKCNTSEERKNELLEDEARYLFELSKMPNTQLSFYEHEKALRAIKDLPDTSKVKWDLICEIKNTEISQKFTGLELTSLLRSRQTFENIEKKRRFCKPDDKFRDSANDVIVTSKRLLELSMNHIKKALKSEKQCSFPSLNKCNKENRKIKLKKILEKKYGWVDFQAKLGLLFDFFIEKLDTDQYPWLPTFIKVRNRTQHPNNSNQYEGNAILEEGEDKATELVRDASNYAADVWKIVKYHVFMYEHPMNNSLNSTSGGR